MLFLKRELLRMKIEEAEHDFLAKEAYVVVRWSRGVSDKDIRSRAVDRMKAKHPNVDRDRIEEMIIAMDFNCGSESGNP